MTQARYYVHGDQSEENPSDYFCARCDQFVAYDHFQVDNHHQDGEKDYRRYLQDIERLPTYMENTRGRYRRPPSPRNCLA